MRPTLTAVAVVLLAAVLWCRPVAEAQQPAVGQRWEYTRVLASGVHLVVTKGNGGEPEVVGTHGAVFNKLGADGWELAAVHQADAGDHLLTGDAVTQYIFKRPLR